MSPIESLSPESSAEQIGKVLTWVAGLPAYLHDETLDEIAKRTHVNKSNLRITLSQSVEQRARSKYPRLELARMLGERDGAEVPDPLDPEGAPLIVRNAKLLDHQPIVQKTSGWSHALDTYIVALIGDRPYNEFLIRHEKVEQTAAALCNADFTRHIPPRQLASANVEAFYEVLQDIKRKRDFHADLIVTLKLNRRFTLIKANGELVAMEEATRAAWRTQVLKSILAGETDRLIVGYDEKKKEHEVHNLSRFEIWQSHPARAMFTGVINAPLGRDHHGRPADVDYKFNMFGGFPEHGSGEGKSWQLLKDHILHVLCSGSEEAYEYLMSWMAHMFQRPWEKPGVAIVTWGAKGAGKGTVADALRAALGSELSNVFINPEHFLGRFAASPIPFLFNQIEEAVFARDPRTESPMKSRITDPTALVELKFRTPYQVDAFERFWFNSNSAAAVPITHDERRYFILHVSDARANDHAYFTAIRQQLYHEGGLAAMIHELKTRDISKFNVRRPPQTNARAAMIIELLKPEERCFVEILRSGELVKMDADGKRIIDVQLNEDGPTWVDKDDVQIALASAFKLHGGKEATASAIGKALHASGLIDGERKAYKTRGQKAAYRFMPLMAAREAYSEKHGIPVEFLKGGDIPMTPDERFRDWLMSGGRIIGEIDLGAEPPERYEEIKPAFEALHKATFGQRRGTNATVPCPETLH